MEPVLSGFQHGSFPVGAKMHFDPPLNPNKIVLSTEGLILPGFASDKSVPLWLLNSGMDNQFDPALYLPIDNSVFIEVNPTATKKATEKSSQSDKSADYYRKVEAPSSEALYSEESSMWYSDFIESSVVTPSPTPSPAEIQIFMTVFSVTLQHENNTLPQCI